MLVLSGDCALEGQPLAAGMFYYLGTQRTDLTVASTAGARVLLIGGTPFAETILMWWNFVARTPDEIGRPGKTGKHIAGLARFRPTRVRDCLRLR